MKRWSVGLVVLTFLAAGGWPARGASVLTPSYLVTSLGSFGGEASTAFGINEAGVAVGVAQLPSNVAAAFLNDGSGIASPGWLSGAFSSQARGVNEGGSVVGTSYTGAGAQATVWTGGAALALGSLGGGESYGLAINDAGQVVGGSTNADGQGRAFLHSGGAWTDIGADVGGNWSSAYGVNNAGQVVGYVETSNGVFRGFLWQDGVVTMLGDLGGALSYAMGISDSGTVVGHAATAGNQLHAFLYDGSMRDLGTLGGSHSYAYGINAAGWAVGHSWLATGLYSHAFVYDGAGMLDLNGLLLNGDGWELLEAYSINDAGQIVGAGLYQGERTAFRLDPVGSPASVFGVDGLGSPLVHNPEPGTVSMMALGLGLLVVGFWRRKRGG